MWVSGVIALDLRSHSSEDYQDTTRRLQDLVHAPAGADVVIHVNPRQFPDVGGLNYLRRHGQHFGSITFHCSDGDTVKSWIKFMRRETL